MQAKWTQTGLRSNIARYQQPTGSLIPSSAIGVRHLAFRCFGIQIGQY